MEASDSKDNVISGNPRKITSKRVDVSTEVFNKTVDYTNEALNTTKLEKDAAACIKKRLDTEMGGTWNCCIGRTFGCSITHNAKNLMFFQLDDINLLIFQTKTESDP